MSNGNGGNGNWSFTINVVDCANDKAIQYPTYTDGGISGQGTAQGVIKVEYPDRIAEVGAVVSAPNYGPTSVSFNIDDDGGQTTACLVSLDGPVGEYPGTGSGW